MVIRVCVYEDNKFVRHSLEACIEACDDMLLVGSFEHAKNVVENIKKTHPNVILMDINLPAVNGIEAVTRIKSSFPEVAILMQTVFEDEHHVFKAIEAGASGYLLKQNSYHLLPQYIRDAYLGGAPLSPTVARLFVEKFKRPRKLTAAEFDLTVKEAEVLSYLVKGNSYKMIATAMNITYDTVRAHMKKIYFKLHVESMTEAVAKALHHKLFEE